VDEDALEEFRKAWRLGGDGSKQESPEISEKQMSNVEM
jgi:hypothetical protein